MVAQIDHGFDCKNHARNETDALPSLTEMRDLRRLVKFKPDAMANKITHHRTPLFLGVHLYGPANIADGIAGFYHGNTAF